METTDPRRAVSGFVTLMMLMPGPSPTRDEQALAILSRVVEAQAAADEANDLLAIGVIDHARYERAACDRDEAVEAAAEFLRRASR